MKDFSSWIDLDCKSYYLDSKKQGLRVIVHDGVDPLTSEGIRAYLRFLRKRYFFPIRCYVHLTENDKYHSGEKGYCYGIFFPGEEKPRRYPSIYLPVKKNSESHSLHRRLYDLTGLLTYYFQWYFMCEERYSHRALEIEATKASNFLVDEYLNETEGVIREIDDIERFYKERRQ